MRRSIYILFLIPFLTFINTGCTSKSNKKVIPNVENQSNENKAVLLNVDSFESGIASNPDAQLVDVRTPGEYKKGHIKGAVNIDYQGDTFMEGIDKLDKNKPTYVYCQSGGRSSEACKYMSGKNFTKLYDLDNGFSAWSHYKKPIEISEE